MTSRPPGARIAVAAPHPLAVRAAEEVAASGGNAVDAAVAAAMCLGVAYPHMTGLGGDLFALLRRPDGSAVSLNASGAHGSAFGEVSTPVPVTGPRSVTVPGAASGWARLMELGGSRPVSELLGPAIALAEDGVPVCRGLAAAVVELREHGSASAPLLALLDRAGHEGTSLRQPALARTLRTLADEGLASFYAGSVSERIARGCAELGVPVTRQDLRGHDVLVEEPWSVDPPGLRVSTSPPNSPGYLLLTLLQACTRLDAPGDGSQDAGHPWLAGLFHRAEQCRAAELADPRHVRWSRDELLDPARMFDTPAPSLAVPPARGDTVAVTAVSADGTAVSLIQSLFHSFGSQVLEPATGLVLHNRGSLFSPDPGSPNSPAPGKRPAHTLMPVLVEYADGRVSAQGAMGGRAQPQIHLQVLRHLQAGMTPQEAVSAPRLLVEDDLVLAEPGVETSVEVPGLRARSLPRHSDGVGHAMVSTLAPEGSLSRGIDPRSDGPLAG